jgi:hypothetical protein
MPELRPTPRPPSPPLDEPGTDPALRAVKADMRSELNWQGAKLTIAMSVVAVATAFGAYRFVLNEAAAQTDAGMRVQAGEQKALEARITTLEKRFDRFDAKMDAALDALRVPQSARPPPMPDGGP